MKDRIIRVAAAATLGVFVGTLPSFADSDNELPYPNVTDAHGATKKVEEIFEGFFTAKSLHNGAQMLTFWANDPVLYIDATAGQQWPTPAALAHASPVIKTAAQTLQAAFASGDAAAATALFTPDAVFEDMALHTRVEGQLQIGRYLTRGLNLLPYGVGASVAHVAGSDQGGGYEWFASQPTSAPLKRGNTALELDSTGKISPSP